MDTILPLLSQLFGMLTPSQFLMVIGTILTATFILVKFAVKQSKKKGGWFNVFGEPPLADELVGRFVKIEMDLKGLLDAVLEQKDLSAVAAPALQAKLEELLLMKAEVQKLAVETKEEVADIKHALQMHEVHEQQTLDTLKEVIQRALENLAKISLQLSKVDDFVAAGIPEFRGYHQELKRDLSELSKDVALVERTIQNNQQAGSSVKLR